MKKNKSVLLSTPYILWMLAFTLIPLCVVGYYALTDPATGTFTLSNLKDLGMYAGVLWQSIGYALVSALICLLLGYPVAYYIAHRKPLTQKILSMLVMLPMCMSFLLRTLAWVGLLQDTGLINRLLQLLGLPRMQLIRTPGAVVLGMVYNFLPYMILPIYTVLTKIDHSVIEAAKDLGANGYNVFTKVLLPQSIPGIISGVTLVVVPAVSTFIISKLLGGGMTYLIGDIIENYFLGNTGEVNYNVGAALSLVLMVLILISMGIMNRFDKDSETSGGGLF